MMKTLQLMEFFERKDFHVHLTEEDGVQCAEIETWTNGGVNMILWLNPFTVEEFKQIVNDFDVDEEIERHRQEKAYKNAFSLRKSLEDFEDFHNRLKEVLSELLNPKQYGLTVTNPVTGDRFLAVGFKSKEQAISFNKFRKMRKTVLRPKLVELTDEIRMNYLGNTFTVDQEGLKTEVLSYFDLL